MTLTTESVYTPQQIKIWIRGLLSLAWADGHFDEEEKALIHAITDEELAPALDFDSFEPISPDDLAAGLASDRRAAENFLRTAVMVALADGVYSTAEDDMLQAFCAALGQRTDILESLRATLCDLSNLSAAPAVKAGSPDSATADHKLEPLKPVRDWLDQYDVHDPRLARFLCKLIPPQCPFERDVVLFGKKIVHIPPMCKLNPLYDQLVGLRFRSLSYLADDCGEDISPYC